MLTRCLKMLCFWKASSEHTNPNRLPLPTVGILYIRLCLCQHLIIWDFPSHWTRGQTVQHWTMSWGRYFLNLPKELKFFTWRQCLAKWLQGHKNLITMWETIAIFLILWYLRLWFMGLLDCLSNDIFSGNEFAQAIASCYFYQGWCVFGCHAFMLTGGCAQINKSRGKQANK